METGYNPLEGGGIKGGGYFQAIIGRIIVFKEYVLPALGIFAGFNPAKSSLSLFDILNSVKYLTVN
jgi:hypothetical protein